MIIEKSSSFGPRLIFTQLLASTALKQDEDKGIDMDEEKDKVKDEMRIRKEMRIKKKMRRRMKRTRTGLNNKGVFCLPVVQIRSNGNIF